jgi:hypothetical protein
MSFDEEVAEAGGNQSEVFMDSRQNRLLPCCSNMKAFIIRILQSTGLPHITPQRKRGPFRKRTFEHAKRPELVRREPAASPIAPPAGTKSMPTKAPKQKTVPGLFAEVGYCVTGGKLQHTGAIATREPR